MNEQRDAKPVQTDKRRNLRAPLLVRKVRLEEDRKVFFGYGKNLSRGGIFIATVNPLEPGTRVTVELPLPPPLTGEVLCRCEVVWNRPFRAASPLEPGMGLRFLDLPADAGSLIDGWARQQ